jgi:hypothetical protein
LLAKYYSGNDCVNRTLLYHDGNDEPFFPCYVSCQELAMTRKLTPPAP